ncbi:thymidylate synthase, partial [bacterium]|nr:thymidylate synthase [bacterium]
RLRNHFCGRFEHGITYIDQISEAIEQLKIDRTSRQVVLQIWDPKDLVADTKDKACNQQIMFRVREVRGLPEGHIPRYKLDMTVTNRSNDFLWGALGANIVQFSVIHSHIAREIGHTMGSYFHISNAMHMYVDGPGGALYERLFAKYGSRIVQSDLGTDLYPEDSLIGEGPFLQRSPMLYKSMGEFDAELMKQIMDMVCIDYDVEDLMKERIDRVRSFKTQTHIGHHLLKPMLEIFLVYRTCRLMEFEEFASLCEQPLELLHQGGFGAWANAAIQFCTKREKV